MNRRLTVHVGPPKTGTTTVQEGLIDGLGELSENGIAYGLPGDPRADFYLAEVLWRKLASDTAPSVEGPTGKGWFVTGQPQRDLISEYSRCYKHRLISCEAFAQMPRPGVDFLLEALRPDQVDLILGLRSPVQWLYSLWQQGCKVPNVEPWPEFVERAKRDRLLFPSQAEAWVDQPLVASIHVVPMRVPGGPDLLTRFARVADLPLSPRLLQGRAMARLNPSMGPVETLLAAAAATRVAHLVEVLSPRYGQVALGSVSRHLLDLSDLAHPQFERARAHPLSELFLSEPFDRSSESEVKAYCRAWAKDALDFAESTKPMTPESRNYLRTYGREARQMVDSDKMWAPHKAGYPRRDFERLVRHTSESIAVDRLMANTVGLLHIRSAPGRAW